MEEKKTITGSYKIPAEEINKGVARKGSTTTTIKSFNNVVSKLIALKMVTPLQGEQLKDLQKIITQTWLSVEMGIETQSTETTK